jgi:hypothetical protein
MQHRPVAADFPQIEQQFHHWYMTHRIPKDMTQMVKEFIDNQILNIQNAWIGGYLQGVWDERNKLDE